MKNIAIIGSSGGNLYNLGGKDPVKLLSEIKLQTDSTEIAISNILFIGADAPMDNISQQQRHLYLGLKMVRL